MPEQLTGRTIAVPETRELDLLAQMLERHGAVTFRCPMVAILDSPDPAPIEDWLKRFAAGGCDDLILLTGEGLRRLLGFADRAGMKERFIAALGGVRTITRGPKPARALRVVGLKPDLAAAEPTTEGVIATLAAHDLSARAVGVQLYADNPNTKLIDFLDAAGARPDPVAPYVYASAAADQRVVDLITEMAGGRIDAIAFTSAPQVRRLVEVAEKSRLADELRHGLARTKVAAVGPVVAERLRTIGARVDITPEGAYFMKPLVNEIVAAFAGTPAT